MGKITINSRVYGNTERIRVEVGTTDLGLFTRDFHDPKEILNMFLQLTPTQSTKVRDFVTRTVNFGESRVTLYCDELDFSKYGFENPPSA